MSLFDRTGQPRSHTARGSGAIGRIECVDSTASHRSAAPVLTVVVIAAGVLAGCAVAARPFVPPDTLLLVLAVGGSFGTIGLICRTQLGTGGPSLLIGGFGVAWLLLLAAASAVGSPALGGALVANLVAAAVAHLLLSQLPGRPVEPGWVLGGYSIAVAAGGLMAGPTAAHTIGVVLAVVAVGAVFPLSARRLRGADRTSITVVLPVWVPGSAALLAYLAAVVTALRGEPPTWLLHGLFGLLAVTPIGFLVTVARRTLVQLRASRARILDAADTERRRIERDLHDGVQQQLVSAAILLDLLGHRANGTQTAHTLGQARMILADARTELRHLCHHLYPSALTDSGLDDALAELVWQAPLPVELHGRAGTLPRAIAATAYYVAAETLTNAVKHAGADRVDIHLARGTRRLRITVSDNGRGGADPTRGTGLRGLDDRVEAVGGRLTVRAGRAGGTVVEASMPCVS